MATLCEMMVFSVSSKFWKTSGLRTFCTPALTISIYHKDTHAMAWGGRTDPYSGQKLDILPKPAQEQLRKAAILASQSGRRQPADLKGCIHH